MQLLVRCIYNYVATNLYELLVETIRENIRVSEGCEEQTEKEIYIKKICDRLCENPPLTHKNKFSLFKLLLCVTI